MIDTMPYAIGFLIYVGFCLVTFNVYSQKKELTKIFVLIFIYLYYTALAGYLISVVDYNASFFEKFMQIFFYAMACGLFLWYHYENSIKQTEVETGYGESPDNRIF